MWIGPQGSYCWMLSQVKSVSLVLLIKELMQQLLKIALNFIHLKY